MIKHLLLFVMALLLFSSCVSEYGIAHRNYPSAKLPVPYAEGKDTSAWYMGASYAKGRASLGLPTTFIISAAEDVHESVQLNTHYGYQSGNVFFSMGVMGYKGIYDLRTFPIQETHGSLDLWGAGTSLEFGFSIPLGEFHIRPFGLKVTGIYEGGEYADFRSEFLDTVINLESFRNGNRDNFLINTSTVFGCSYHPGDWNYSLDIITGISDEDLTAGINSYITYKRVSLSINYTIEYIKGRYALSGGLIYQF